METMNGKMGTFMIRKDRNMGKKQPYRLNLPAAEEAVWSLRQFVCILMTRLDRKTSWAVPYIIWILDFPPMRDMNPPIAFQSPKNC